MCILHVVLRSVPRDRSQNLMILRLMVRTNILMYLLIRAIVRNLRRVATRFRVEYIEVFCSVFEGLNSHLMNEDLVRFVSRNKTRRAIGPRMTNVKYRQATQRAFSRVKRIHLNYVVVLRSMITRTPMMSCNIVALHSINGRKG